MNYQVVIPAAGQGKRMKAGKNKQFIELNQIPLIIHTLRVFEKHSYCVGVILVINEAEVDDFQELLKKYKVTKVKHIVTGGSERQYSVYNGLKVASKDHLVLVHDGARPFVSHPCIEELVKTTIKTGAATLAVPVKDTITQVEDGVVEKTLNRSQLFSIQTPQAFHVDIILKAHERALQQNFLGTDDASLLEKSDQHVSIVLGDYTNIKVTTPEDLFIAEAILRR
ncbi:2-C-methyl-D-erythritol 4-phosphate cytidylyltransferase [Metabacillus sp. HB246100]|uniref:2-C-methyl-D-erythritol 4-phosphate cytidylyltransferase n=1 Tax=Bacillus weihaiensis TaxID=1547283 RepID=UPI002352B698|nr:2-C-methyl-D-erythritol 4-phosphate cytidylyltransferase [Bacillus weihaiensis]